MVSQLENELFRIKHCCGVNKQNNIVNSVHVYDWTVESSNVSSNLFCGFLADKVNSPTLQSGPSSELMNPGMHKQKYS